MTPKEDEIPVETPKRDPSTLRTITEMYKAVHSDYGMQPAETMRELGVSRWADITDSPAECYIKIAAIKIEH